MNDKLRIRNYELQIKRCSNRPLGLLEARSEKKEARKKSEVRKVFSLTSCFLLLSFILVCIRYSLVKSDVIYNVDSNTKTLFSDVKAYKVGDLLTILIAESTTAGNTAQTKTEKDFDFNPRINVGNGKKGVFDFLEQLGLSKDESFSGGGKTTRSGFFTAKLTVKVVEILDDGNLKVEGSQELLVNNEKQIIKISGVVRPVDVTKDNTVYSTYIADAKITYEGKGPLAKKQKEGFFSKLFDWLF